MARSRRGLMSEELKTEIAKELGVHDIVQREGWGGVSPETRQYRKEGYRKG